MKQIPLLLVAVILCTGIAGIIAPVHGLPIEGFYNSPIGVVNISTSIPDSPAVVTAYRVVPNPNDMAYYSGLDLEKVRSSVSSETDAPQIAQNILNSYGGLPSDAILTESSIEYLIEMNGTTNEEMARYPVSTNVQYGRKINDVPVVGDGAYINMELGDNGELLYLNKVWRTVTADGNLPIKPVSIAITKLREGEVLNPKKDPHNVDISKIRLGYFERGFGQSEEYLEPAWLFKGTTESGDPIQYYVYTRQFANFIATPIIASTGDIINFTDTSEASPIKWYWDFSDGTNSTLKNPTHTYQTGGNYTINLTAWNDFGSDTISRTEYITIYPDPKPAASFTTNASWETRFPPEAVSFNDTSVGYLTNWSWDFGDGTNSTEQSPTHVFNLIPGDVDNFYPINLTVTDCYGRTSMSYDSIYVQMDYHPNFTAEPTRGPAPLNVTFTDTSPPLNNIDGLWWYFGDGTHIEWYNDGSGATPPHTVAHEYTTDGYYSVALSIMPSYHAETSFSTTKDDMIYVGSIYPPNANFTANVISGKVPLGVSFTDTSTEAPASWNWSFGDGIFSDEQNPVHTYTIPGTYTVALQVTNIDGNDSEIRLDYIAVQPLSPPVANFTANPVSGIVLLTVTFNDTSSASPTSWTWDFGDGTTSAEQNPVHEFTAAGTYTVSLTATNDDGSDSETRPDFIIVTPVIPLVADFTANTTSGNVPLAVEFTDTSFGTPTSWSWTFGDGGVSAEQNPVHVYPTTGTYSVSLEVTNPDGSNTKMKTNYITVLPVTGTVQAGVRIEPETLNLKSKGTFTAFITLPTGYDVNNIDLASLVCEGAHAKSGHATGEGSNMYIAKFNRQDLTGIFPGDAVTFIVTGNVITNGDSIDFEGSDTIRVI